MRSDVIRNKSMGKICSIPNCVVWMTLLAAFIVNDCCVRVCLYEVHNRVRVLFVLFLSFWFIRVQWIGHINVVYCASVHFTCLLPYRLNLEKHCLQLCRNRAMRVKTQPPTNRNGHEIHHQIDSIEFIGMHQNYVFSKLF